MTSSKNVQVLERDADFKGTVLESDLPVLVNFGATWCGPCKELAPIVDEIADSYAGRLKVVTVDIDECPDESWRWGAKSVPTLVVFKGGMKVCQSTGLTTREHIIHMLEL